MSAAERHEPLLDAKRLSPEQHRWPTLGWAIGELRWYLIGGLVGAGVAMSAFVVWLTLTQLNVI
jgi:hypothetical protein